MRTLTATMETAMEAMSQKPSVRVQVRDKQLRAAGIGDRGEFNEQMAMCSLGSGLAVAVLDNDGDMWFRRVVDGATWTTVNPLYPGWDIWSSSYTRIQWGGALAWPHGDIAISNNAGVLRIFFFLDDGTELRCRDSSDNGATWGGVQTVKVLAGGVPTDYFFVASPGEDRVFWCRWQVGDAYVYFRKLTGITWGSEAALAALQEGSGEWEYFGGLGAYYSATAGYIGLVCAGWSDGASDGRLVFAKVAYSDGAIISRARIAPPGYAPVGCTPRYPAIVRTTQMGGLWVVSYVDEYTSGGATASPRVLIVSRDADHWSYKIPMEFGELYTRRLNLALSGTMWVAAQVQEAAFWSCWTAEADAPRHMELSTTLQSVDVVERPDWSRLTVEVDNQDGYFDSPGVVTGYGGPLGPLAQVTVDLGMLTSAGEERVSSRAFLLWSITRVRKPGENLARLNCVDGWDLFRLWQPDAMYVFEGKTVRWCIEELAARVGFWEVSFDGSIEWDYVLEYVSVVPQARDSQGNLLLRALDRWVTMREAVVALGTGSNGYTVMQDLLLLVGGQARWGKGADVDHLYCFILNNTWLDGVAYSYLERELLETEIRDGFQWPTRVRVVGDGVGAQLTHTGAGAALGMEILGQFIDDTWTTLRHCQSTALWGMADGRAREWGGRLVVRPNPCLELFDMIVVIDSRLGLGGPLTTKRVNQILTQYDSKGKWRQELRLEGW